METVVFVRKIEKMEELKNDRFTFTYKSLRWNRFSRRIIGECGKTEN